jgi:metal-responsive CopG/Arc/MetJ family transcriptional regulator
VDEQVKDEKSRSAFIETAIRTYLEVLKRQKRDQNDLSIINQNMENLNREAIDVLRYQTEL